MIQSNKNSKINTHKTPSSVHNARARREGRREGGRWPWKGCLAAFKLLANIYKTLTSVCNARAQKDERLEVSMEGGRDYFRYKDFCKVTFICY